MKQQSAHQVKHKQAPPMHRPGAGDDAQTLAKKQAANLTGVPLSQIGKGKHPVVGGRKPKAKGKAK